MIVVKLGGRTFETLQGRDRLLAEVAALAAHRPVVLVHGGGNRITQRLAERGVATRFSGGLRVTDAAALAVARDVLAEVGAEIVSGLAARGVRARARGGNEGGMITAEQRHELGLVGRITGVRTQALVDDTKEGLVPVVAPLAATLSGDALNVNADEVAGALAARLPASRLLLLTDVDHVLGPEGPLEVVNAARARDLIALGAAKDGMTPKLEAALAAVEAGCGVVIANGNREGVVEGALLGVVGTRVV